MTQENVVLSIIGEQALPDGETNRVEVITQGQIYEKQGIHYIEYDEQEESGLDTLHTRLSIEPDMVTMMRTGKINTHMVFTPGRKSYNAYETPAGPMEMGIFPTFVRVDMGANEGEIALEYQLELAGHYASHNMLSLVWRRTNTGNSPQ